MIFFDEALDDLLALAHPLGKRTVPFDKSLGYFLAQDLKAREPIPLFDQSAMDGYGVKWEDVQDASEGSPVRLPVVEVVQAGGVSRRALKNGAAVRIFTGGKIPAGVDTVVVQEWCKEKDQVVSISRSLKAGSNLRLKGEEFAKGAPVLSAGTRITPPVVGLLATLGYAEVKVFAKPRVGLIVTGDELIVPGEQLHPGQIRDSNSYALAAALRELGIEELLIRRASDDKQALRKSFLAVMEKSDFILTAGGISVGEYDFVKEVAEEIGFRTVFWKVAIKPGMPNYLGIHKSQGTQKLLFGMPGNPVSALISCHEFIKPALLQMMGHPDPRPLLLKAALDRPIRKKAGRLEFVRGVLRQEKGQLMVAPTEGQGSHMLSGLVAANCLIRLPLETTGYAAGDLVDVEIISWGGPFE